MQKRIESLQQQNKVRGDKIFFTKKLGFSLLHFCPSNQVLKCELETYKLRVKSLQEENRAIRQASVHIVSLGSAPTSFDFEQ